jgi:hypothetical protein
MVALGASLEQPLAQYGGCMTQGDTKVVKLIPYVLQVVCAVDQDVW